MPTTREAILQSLHAVLQRSRPPPSAAAVPERIPARGLLILRDGDPSAPEVLLSPPAYLYEHRAEVDAIVEPGDA